MAGKDEKIEPKRAKIVTPADKDTKPTEVAITGTVLGPSITNFEELFARAIGMVVFGDSLSTATKLDDLKSPSKKNNISELINNQLKSQNDEKKQKKKLDDVKTILNDVSSSIISTIAASSSAIVVGLSALASKPQTSSEAPASSTLSVILDSDNLDEILRYLSEMSNDYTFDTLADSFQMMTENSEKFPELASNLNDIIGSLVALSQSTEDIKGLNVVLPELNNTLTNFSTIKGGNEEAISSIVDSIISLSTAKIDPQSVANVVNSVTYANSELAKIDTTSIDIKQFDDLKTLVDKIKIFESIQSVKLENLDELIANVPKINNLIHEVGTIEKIDPSTLVSFDEFIKWIGTIEFKANEKIPTEFVDIIKVLNETVVPQAKTLINSLNDFSISNEFPKKLNSLKTVIKKINSINVDTSKSKLKITDTFIENIDKISEAGPEIEKLVNNTQNLKSIKVKDIDNIVKIVNKLSELNFTGKNEINKKALKDIKNAIKPICEIFEEFNKHFVATKYSEIATGIDNIIDILVNLDKVEFDGDSNINIKKLNEISTKALPKISNVIKKISEIDIDDSIVIKTNNIIKTLLKVDYLAFSGKRKINIAQLKKLDNTLPTILSICAKINEKPISKGEKNIDNLSSTLKAIGKISTKEFEKKNFSKVAEVMTVLMGVTNIAASFDESSTEKVSLIKSFIDEFIEKEGSPLKTLTNSTTIEEFNKKESDIKRLSDTTKMLTDAIKAVAAIGALGAMVTVGIKVLRFYVKSIQDVIQGINHIDSKQVHTAMQTMKGMALVIAISTICMLIGGFFIVKMPELVIGSIAFGLALGMFMFVVLGALNLASRGMKMAFETAKSAALLIAVCTFVMLIGAVFMLVDKKLFIASLAFGLALGMFMFVVLGVLNLASRGMKIAFETAKSAALLIAVCAFVMIVGATFVLFFPKLIAGAFVFTGLLGLFMFTIIGTLKLASKNMNSAMKSALGFAKLITVSTLSMLIGGLIVLLYPRIIAGCLLFSVTLGTFMFMVMKGISKGSKGMKKNLKNIKNFAILVGIAAGVLLLGGGLMAAMPNLAWSTPLFGVTFAGFTYLMGKALKELSKQNKNIIKGASAMAIIGAVTIMGATAMLIISNAMKQGILDVAAGALIMSVTLGIVAAMSVAMGAAAANPFFWAGIGAMAAVSGIVMIGALAMLAVAKAMKIFKEVGSFDIKPMLSNIAGLISIATALAPIGLLSPVIVAASIAVASLSIAISKISEAVAEAASLKIPIYIGTKKIGYRQLSNKDFKDAAKNIKTIVTVLGKAIIDIYEKNPQIFDTGFLGMQPSPFTTVVKSTSGLGKLIAKIAEGVKDYADLKIPIYSGTKVTGYKHLTNKDFKSAADNVKYVIECLAGALIKLYEEHPDMFKDNSIFSFMGENPGNTPLSRTISVTMRLGKLISLIAAGVQNYANLKIPIAWNKDGRAVNFRSMTSKEVQLAADNVKYVIECLAGALIKLYEEHPDMFKDNSIFSFMGEKPGNTPLSRTISVTMKLGKLISNIAAGIQNFANLTIPIAWNKDGKAINFKSMSQQDIQGAANNVKYVIECLAGALLTLYKENTKMFNDDSIFSFMGEKPGNTPLSRTISVNMKLGKLISSIANGVQKFGNLSIPIAWNKDGRAVKFQKMTDAEIQKAGENVKNIVTTLGGALMESYKEHKDWYTAPKSLFEAIFGGGGGAKKTPFYTVVSVNIRLAELISNIGKAVGNMAKLMIPTDWNKDGKAVAFRQLNDNDFNLAGENVGKVITTLGNAVMQQYEDHHDWFEDEDGDLMENGKNKFSIVMKSTLGLSNIIKNIAAGIKDYANLLIPDQWDKEGKAIHYRELTNTDFKNASDNIGLVITTVGNSLMKIYEGHEEWFETDNGLFSSDDSDFNKVLTGCVAMGEMISSISEGIVSLAQLQIPTAWDPKSGKPIKFREMKETDFTMASNSIDKVVSIVGQSLINLYESRTELFETDEDNPDSVFVKVAQGCSYLGDMIKGIAEGVVEMATLEETLKKAGINMTTNTYKEAAEKVSQVVCVVGEALMITFGKRKEWFQNPPIVTKKNGVFGIGGSTEIKPDNSDTPFQKMVKACALMGQMIIGIAEGVAFFATITQQPLPDGSKMDIPTATANIGLIITTIGKALMDVTNSASWYSIDKLEPIISAVQKSANAVHSVASLLEKIGKGNIPITDKEGNVIDTIPLNNNSIAAAAKTIGLVLSGVSSGLESAEKLMDKSDYSMFRESTKLNLMLDNINKAIEIVGKNVRTLAYLGSGKINLWNKDYTQIVETIEFTESDFAKAGRMIGTIMSTVAKGVNDAYKSISEYYPGFLFIEHGISNSKSEGIGQMLNAIERAVSIVGENVKQLGQLAQGKINLWNNGKIVETISFNETSFKTAANMIVTILTTVASGVNTATKSVWGLFGSEKWEESDPYKMLKAVEGAKNTVGAMTLFLAHLGNGEYVYFDTRYKGERRVPVSLTGIDTAAKMISYAIQEIAWGIGNGTSYVASLNMDNITKMLHSVEMAKDTVGRMALFLSHLANNEYVYFDTRYKRERKVTITEDGMIMAARIISGIITNIASGISEAVTSTSSSDVWGGFIWVGSKAYNMLQCVSKAIDNVGNVAFFVSNLGNNEYVYHDIFDGFKEKRISITEDSAKNAAKIIKTIITSIADSISQATNKLDTNGFTVFGKSDSNDKISLTFYALNKATSMLGRLAKVVSYYANGEIAEVVLGTDGTMAIKRSGAPDVETAKKNMSTIITGLADIIKSTSEKINEIEDIDSTIFGLHKSLRVVDASIYAVNEITKAKANIDALKGFNFSSIMTPVLSDIDKVFAQMNSIGQKDKSEGIFGKLFSSKTPFQQFIDDTNSMIMQSLLIASVPLEESYNKLKNVILSTTDTMAQFHLPDNFEQQTESLDKFIKSVNTIKVDGVDSLTELLTQLNKMGINMGNLDRLVDAIANKLVTTLNNMRDVMKAVDKSIKADIQRRTKHKDEVKKSVKEIKDLFDKPMQVEVKMAESESDSSVSSNSTSSDDSKQKTDNPTEDGKNKSKKKNK